MDNDLVVDTDEEVFEMNNGCICCTVRGDLIRIVGGLMKRRDKFDGIIIETTGLANPAPVAQTFFVDDDVEAKTRLDAIVTVVDAKHLPARLADSHEAEDQIAFADVIVLNKTDLVTPEELEAVERTSARSTASPSSIAPSAPALPIEQVLDRGAFDLQRVLAMDAGLPGRRRRARAQRRRHLDELRGRASRSTRRSSTPGSARCCRTRARTCCAPRASWPTPTRTGASPSRPCT